MTRCRRWRRQIPEAIYGELDAKTRERMGRHIAACSRCAGLYESMARTVRKMDARPAPDRSPQFWEDYWDRLESRMARESSASAAVRRRPFRPPAWAYGAAGAVLLLAAGIFIGRTFFRPVADLGPVARTVSPGTAAGGSAARDAGAVVPALDVRASRYLRRSRTLLLAVINAGTGDQDPFRLSLPLQKKTSEALLQEAHGLKKELMSSDRRLERLISDLEMILLQIANLKPDADVAAIEIIRAGVESRDILFKINLRQVRRSTGKSGAGQATRQGNERLGPTAVRTAASV